jgi:uncharacterized membrane protein (UPF0127 family)
VNLVWWLLACGSASGLPLSTLQIDGQPLPVEVADTDAARSLGLMNRDALPADAGMLFVYDNDRIREFWMKDTRIPLSIAFVDKTGKIVKIADMQPFDTTHTSSVFPARYAIEVNQGWFGAHGVDKGDRVSGLPGQSPP